MIYCGNCGGKVKHKIKFCPNCGHEVLTSDPNPRFSRPPVTYAGQGKRLTRSRNNRWIAGVCGGIGEHTNIDPTVIRLIWLLSLFTGIGWIAYLIAIILIPENALDPWAEPTAAKA